MAVEEDVREILKIVLQIGNRAENLDNNSPLLGNIPELDSMAVECLSPLLRNISIF